MGKSLQELTIMDNWMFGAVMLNPDICKRFLEIALDMEIDHVQVFREKSLVYNPQYKGVRLDVYAKDEKNTCYNVEMQVRTTPIPRRSRYYHSQIDMELLLNGRSYDELPDSYVIFIVNYDPFGLGKYRYSFRQECREAPGCYLGDGSRTIILNNRGRNSQDVSPKLRAFLEFTKADLRESEEEFGDDYVHELQKKIHQIKTDREMGGLYMTFQEMLREEREEGWKEGMEKGRKEGIEAGMEKGRKEGIEEGRLKERRAVILEYLKEKECLNDQITARINTIRDIDQMKEMSRYVIEASSPKEIIAALDTILDA